MQRRGIDRVRRREYTEVCSARFYSFLRRWRPAKWCSGTVPSGRSASSRRQGETNGRTGGGNRRGEEGEEKGSGAG